MSKRGKAHNKNKEAVILLIDVGKAVGDVEGDGKSFLDKSKKCASRIIQRKIFSEAKDQFSLILIGSEETENELDYPNIKVRNKYVCSANWDLLHDVERLSGTNVDNGDWLDSLIVAVNLLKNESECKDFSSLKIVMMSNFATPIRSREQVDDTIEALKELKINLVVIGPEVEDENSEGNEEQYRIQRKGLAIIGRIAEEADGVMCGFSEAMSQLDRFQSVTSKAAAWYCDLQIGSEIFIPMVGYKKFDAKNLLKWKKRSIDNSTITEERVFFKGDQQLEKDDVINSYLFGDTVVPFSEEDRSAVSLTTEKCFQVIGFTKKENVPCYKLIGDSPLYITARNGFDGATTAVTALAKALLDSNMVGVVRRVYCKNSAPRIGALVPVHENNCLFFYWVQLPFAEDEKRLTLPSLRKVKPSQEQLDAADKLIDSMDLSMLDEDEDPYIKPLDPTIEHAYSTIVFKVMNPSTKLPTEPSEAVQSLLKPKPELLENATDALDNIKRLFPLEEIQQKTYRRGAADVFKRTSQNPPVGDDAPPQNMGDSIVNFVQSTVTEVGTADPNGNFIKLLEQGEPFGNLCEQMQSAIKKLIFMSSNSVGVDKSISALSLLRTQCVSRNPASYNLFIASLKDNMVQRENTELWGLIVKDRLGLITSDETHQSIVSADEADVFYEMKKCESQNEPNYEMEAEDLLDEL